MIDHYNYFCWQSLLVEDLYLYCFCGEVFVVGEKDKTCRVILPMKQPQHCSITHRVEGLHGGVHLQPVLTEIRNASLDPFFKTHG